MSPRLFAAIASLEARQAMSYRADFWLSVLIAPLTQFAVSYSVWAAVFSASDAREIAGYDLAAMVRYYVAAILVGKLVTGREFEDAISSDIYQGGLNRYIVYPAPFAPFKYAQHLGTIAPLVVQVAVLAVAAHVALPAASLFALPPERYAMTAASIAVGNLMCFALAFPIQAVAFWADNVWSLVVAKRFALTLFGGLWFPLAFFSPPARAVLAWLPFQCVYDLPARVLLGQATTAEWLWGLAIGTAWLAAFSAIGALMWRRGRLRYAGVGM